jgi:hypothetical protein
MSKRFFGLIRWVVLVIFLSPIFASVSHARDPIDPTWPWEKELDFPWDIIGGIWGGIHDDEATVFSFEIIDDTPGQRHFKVQEINPETMLQVSHGLGVENNNVLRAVMTGKGHRYRMSVRHVENSLCLDNGQYIVVTIESMGRQSYVYHFSIEKLSNSPLTQPSYFNYKLVNFSKNSLNSSMCFQKAHK